MDEFNAQDIVDLQYPKEMQSVPMDNLYKNIVQKDKYISKIDTRNDGGTFNIGETSKPSFQSRNYNIENAYNVNPFTGEYEAKFDTYKEGIDNNEYNAQKQTLTEKWGNGLAKLGIKSATAVIGGTVGIVDSLITGISEGSISEGYNSKLNKTLDKVNEYVDYKLPNLVTEQEKNASFLGQMGYANFYADKVLGGLSFMTGAIISEAVWSAATAATFGAAGGGLAATTARNAEKLGLWGEKAGMWGAKALGGEANVLKVLNKAKEITKSPLTGMLDDLALKQVSNVGKNFAIKGYSIGKGLDIIIPMARSAAYESGMEARMFMKQTEEDWLDKYRQENGKSPSSEEFATFRDELSSTANGIFAGNMAILSVSNYLQFGKAMQGATTAGTITNSFKNKMFGLGFKKAEANAGLEAIQATRGQRILGRVYGLGEGFATEGIYEEMGQSVISGTGENFMRAGFDKDTSKSNYGLMDAFGEALHKTYSTKEGWTEGLIGGLIGVMGGVGGGIKNKMTKDSKGERQAFFDIDNERVDLQNAVDHSNALTTAMHINNIKSLNKMAFSQQLEDVALRNNDISGQELAKTSFTINKFERDMAIGGLDNGIKDFNLQVNNLDNKELMEEMGLETVEQAEQYKKEVILEHKQIAEDYKRNLSYAETLIGNKDFQGREDLQQFLKGQTIVGSGTQEIQRAIAMTLSLGEKSKKIYRQNVDAILDESAALTGNVSVTEAIMVQDAFTGISKEKQTEINRLKTAGKNLNNRLITLQKQLHTAGKIKQGEEASERTNRLLDITNQIDEVEAQKQEVENQKTIAIQSLDIAGNNRQSVTFEMIDNHEKNTAEFKKFMVSLKSSNPQKYAKMIELLNQQDKAIRHIKNYEKSVKAITDKTTRLKTVGGWINELFTKNAKLTDGQKEYFKDILINYGESNAEIQIRTTLAEESRIAFGKKKEIEKVSDKYIEELKSKDYNSLLKIDQDILDAYNKSDKAEASMQMPKVDVKIETKKADIEKRRQEEINSLGRKVTEKRLSELREATSGKDIAISIFNVEKNIKAGATLTNEEQSFLDKKKQELKDKGLKIIDLSNNIHHQNDKVIVENSKNLEDNQNLTKKQIEVVEESLISDEKKRNKLKAQGLSDEEIENYFENYIVIMEAITPQINENGVMIQSSKITSIVIERSEINDVLERSKKNPRDDRKARLDKINAKYTELEKTKTVLSSNQSEIETKKDNLQALKDRVQELTSHNYYLNYFGESFEQKQRDKPKEIDLKEYEELLAKWNRGAETKLARVLARPSDYKYKQDIGLTSAELDRLKELNTILGDWMTFQGTDAGSGESVSDLMERINILERTQMAENTKKENTDDDYKELAQPIEIDKTKTDSKGNNGNNQRAGQTPLQALVRKDNNGNEVFSHTSVDLIASFFNDVASVVPSESELVYTITFDDGRTVTIQKLDRGRWQIPQKEWEATADKRNVIIRNWGNAYSGINKSIGLDAYGNEQFIMVEGDATYPQTDGTNRVINADAVNNIKSDDEIDLVVSTTDAWNNKGNTTENKELELDYQIYMYSKGEFLGALPANRSEEKADDIGLPLLQLRKNAMEYVNKKISEGETGDIQLPYKVEASMVLIGQPNITLSTENRNEKGEPTAKQNTFTATAMQLVRGTGYIQNGVVVTNAKGGVDVNQFIKKVKGDKKIPFVVFEYNGKNVAFPVDLIQNSTPQDTELREMFAPPKEGQTTVKTAVKINKLLETLTDNNIDPNQFGLDYTNAEDFLSQTEGIEKALQALANIKTTVDVEQFAKENYKMESLKDDATIALEIDGTPFLSSKIIIRTSDKITDVTVPLEKQKEDLKNQETRVINEIAPIGKYLIDDYNNTDNKYIDSKGKSLTGAYHNNFDGKVIENNSDINSREIVNTVRKAVGTIDNKDGIDIKVERVKKGYDAKIKALSTTVERVMPFNKVGQLKGINSNSQITMFQGSDKNAVTLLVDPEIKKEYAKKLKQYKERFNKKGVNFKNILKDIAKRYQDSYGKDVILDLRGIDLNQIEDNIIYDLENSKLDIEKQKQALTEQRNKEVLDLRSQEKIVESRDINGEILIKVPKVVKDRLPSRLVNNLQNKLRELDRIKAKQAALTVAIKDRDLAEQARQAEEDANNCP